MKPIPENILRCMNPSDRRPLGKSAMLSSEAQAVIDAKEERILQNQIASLLRQRGLVFCQPSYGKKTRIVKGWPDFSLPYFGRAIYFEAKAKGGKASADQEKMHADLKAQGGFVYVIRELQEAKNVLDWFQVKFTPTPERKLTVGEQSAPDLQTSGAGDLIK